MFIHTEIFLSKSARCVRQVLFNSRAGLRRMCLYGGLSFSSRYLFASFLSFSRRFPPLGTATARSLQQKQSV